MKEMVELEEKILRFKGFELPDKLEREGVTILGTAPETIDLAEDRERFSKGMQRLGIPLPESGMAATVQEALEVVDRIG